MIKFRQKGDFSNLTKYLKKTQKVIDDNVLDKYAKEGLIALSSATPVKTGLTANSWYYKIEKTQGVVSINFYNSNVQNGVPIAVILQYGHGTHNGGWVEGIDYINPTIQPIFNNMVKNIWREVTNL